MAILFSSNSINSLTTDFRKTRFFLSFTFGINRLVQQKKHLRNVNHAVWWGNRDSFKCNLKHKRGWCQAVWIDTRGRLEAARNPHEAVLIVQPDALYTTQCYLFYLYRSLVNVITMSSVRINFIEHCSEDTLELH